MNLKEGKTVKGGRNTPPTTPRPPEPKGQTPQYPECEKLKMVINASLLIVEFLEWLSSKKNLSLCEWKDGYTGQGYYSSHYQIEDLLAEFFEIDLKKVEEERRQIIEDLRK